MDFLNNLCGCFSTDFRKNIINYLNSSNLNSQVIEEEKCSEDDEAPPESIYAQAKQKSYYFMKLKEQDSQEKKEPLQMKAALQQKMEEKEILDPTYYPELEKDEKSHYDFIYSKKLTILKYILKNEADEQYSKVYDSQDELNLKIYSKPEIHLTKRYNSFRFSFRLHNDEKSCLKVDNYLNLLYSGENGNTNEPLLQKRLVHDKTENGLQICHRTYNKVLVINQHEFYTVEKSEKIEEDKRSVVYNTIFSIKSKQDKSLEYSLGWINLCGCKISTLSHNKSQDNSTSLRDETEQYLLVQGYMNIELDIHVNANMLKQPIAKEIRIYVQRLIGQLTDSDAL